jgi:hypothetical protein
MCLLAVIDPTPRGRAARQPSTLPTEIMTAYSGQEAGAGSAVFTVKQIAKQAREFAPANTGICSTAPARRGAREKVLVHRLAIQGTQILHRFLTCGSHVGGPFSTELLCDRHLMTSRLIGARSHYPMWAKIRASITAIPNIETVFSLAFEAMVI